MIEDLKHNDYNILVLYLLGELSPEEKQTVEEWIRESHSHQEIFASIKKVWDATGDIEPAPVVVDVDRAWESMQQKMLVKNVPRPDFIEKSPKSNIRRIYTYVSAAAVITLVTLTFVLSDWFKKEAEPVVIRVETLAEIKKDTLQDGSAIMINKNSALAINEMVDAEERTVELDGEAFFAVEPDTAKPFVVKTNLGAIRVHGTKFNVRAYSGSDLEVTVEEGLVSLVQSDENGLVTDELYLHAGEKGIISAQTGDLYKAKQVAPDELYWANRRLIFQETELRQVFAILSDYYAFDFQVENEEILDCALTASFTNQDLDHILEVIAATFELEMSWEDSVYYFNGKGCLDD